MATPSRISLMLMSALAFGACGHDLVHESAWRQVSEHTGCEALSPQFCVGAFGFTVRPDGAFTVGPAGGGQTLGGTLTDAERVRISADAEAVGAHLTTDLACDRTALIPGVTDRIDLVSGGLETVSVYQINPGAVCYRAPRDAALRLHTDLAALMAKYYPRPFPAS
jgi:hypothetical protein